MKGRMTGIVGIAGAAMLAGCLGSTLPGKGLRSPGPGGSGTVVSGDQLRGNGGALLDGLVGRVSNLRVDRRTAGRCPLLLLRGQRTLMGNSNPRVYVDGTSMGDTCILEQIRVAEVARVEVYPSGITHRPGYRTSPYGLVLVFLKGPEVSR